MKLKYPDCDFHGYATKANLTCRDKRVILPDAFKDQDGEKVPLCWGHQHNSVTSVLGHAYLENRPDGVYAYGYFNDTDSGRAGKKLVDNGDVCALSIWANDLVQNGANVVHGVIRELSLVLAGANPGAYIDSVIQHGDDSAQEAEILFVLGKDNIQLVHSADSEDPEEDELKHAEEEAGEKKDKEETVEDVLKSMNEKQKNVLYALLAEALAEGENNKSENQKEDAEMKHNVFDNDQGKNEQENTLSHDAMEVIFRDGKRCGSLKESVLAHADEYGIQQIDWLFPEAKTLNNPPEFIQRDMGWVKQFMAGVHKSPFSRIKSVFADITEDDARAKGYLKGNMKKEEFFSLLKRTTTPTTIYKKQKMDRDDMIDITDFDVVAWLKGEMRMMLDEEIARAALVSDGRLASSDDKINEGNIRPIYNDDDLYCIKKQVHVSKGASENDKASTFIRCAIQSRKNYKGSGTPTLYTTEDMLTNCLLLTDTTGRDLYEDIAKLAKKLRVKDIVTVPVMEGMTGVKGGELMGIIVNPADYNIGADKGGAVNMFDDFDIDYNQQKYLIETRCSGALTKPYSAIALELDEATA